ncbi:MAG: carboxypeptidase-like regulatory domain-containing protein [Planctomycetota bacterium]
MKQVLLVLLGLFVAFSLYVVVFDSAWSVGETPGGPTAHATDAPPVAEEAELEAVAATESASAERSALPATPDAVPAAAMPAELASASSWRLLVVDALDAPLGGASLALENGDLLETDADGKVTVAFDPLPRDTNAPVGGLTLVALGRPLGVDADLDAVWVLAPTIEVRGRVVDLDGAPLAGVDVSVEQGDGRCRLERVLTDSVSFDYSNTTRSDGLGEFSLEVVPVHPCNRFVLRAEGFEAGRVATTEVREGRLEVALAPLPPPAPADEGGLDKPQRVEIEGLVLDAQGQAVEGAEVLWWGRFNGIETPPSDATGRFVIEVPKPEQAELLLVAKHPDHGLAVEPEFGAWVLETWPNSPGMLVLRFDAEPLSISGRIVDSGGAALAGVTVGLFESTLVTEDMVGTDLTVEGDARTETGVDGAFRIEGLIARDYTLIAYDAERMLVDRLDGVAAGTRGLEWNIGAGALLPRVEGRVVTRTGAPLEAAQVRVSSVVWVARGEYGSASSSISGDAILTDVEGRFVIEDVPARHATLVVSAPQGLRARPPSIATEDIDPDQPLQIVVPLERPIRIELADADPGYERGTYTVVLEDAFGSEHRGTAYTRNGSSTSTRLALGAFDSPVWWSSDEVVQARLLVGWTDEELDSAAVVVGEDGVARVRLRAR